MNVIELISKMENDLAELKKLVIGEPKLETVSKPKDVAITHRFDLQEGDVLIFEHGFYSGIGSEKFHPAGEYVVTATEDGDYEGILTVLIQVGTWGDGTKKETWIKFEEILKQTKITLKGE